MSARTFTPDVVTVHENGRKTTTMHLKRCCNGCGAALGDVEDRDVDDSGNLTDVRAECEHCAPMVELEGAGCTTWHFTRRSISEDPHNWLRGRVKPYRETDDDGYPVLHGIVLDAGNGLNPVTVLWGDWIIRHPDGHFTVHAGPAEVTP